MRNLFLIPLLATSLPLATVLAAPADLPKTGQTTCSDANGATIDCANTGQDGELQSGVAWPNPRFTVGTDTTADCVTDRLTGLMWMREPGSLGAVDWGTALSLSNNLSLCGFSDWRLSNVREIESLTHSGVGDGVAYLNSQGFSGVQSAYYWTSTSGLIVNKFIKRNAWSISMGDGALHTSSPKVMSQLLWPVRGGQ